MKFFCLSRMYSDFLQPYALATVMALAVAVTLSSGCTVLEDRTGCPCTFRVNLSRVDTEELLAHGHDVLHVGVKDDVPVPLAYLPEEIIYDVPRGEVRLFAVAAPDMYVETDGTVAVAPGEEFPEVYTHYMQGLISLARTDTVFMHRNHCSLRIRLLEEDAFRSSLEVSGMVRGYDPAGGLLAGDFRVDVSPDGDGVCAVRIPRQADGSLRLTFDKGTDVQRTYAIGEYIIAGGYDWTAPDLEDISVSVSLSRIRLEFSTALYPETVHIDVVI